MEFVIFSFLLVTTSFSVIKVLTNLVNKLEEETSQRNIKVSGKSSIGAAISIATLFVLFIPTESFAQTCPDSYSVNGSGAMTLSWNSSPNRPTVIDSMDFSNHDTPDTIRGITGAFSGQKAWKPSALFTAADGTASSASIHLHTNNGLLVCGYTSGALPIELMYFKGEILNGHSVLSWATASETNNSHFTIERSTDNENWTVVTVISGAGNTVNVNKYSAVDYSAFTGTAYYRLRQDDYNGDYTYSNTIALENNLDNKFTIMGMYVENNTLKVSVSGTTENETVEIQIISLLGTVQTVKTLSANEFNGNQVELDIANLKGGVYNITIKKGNDVTSGKFIK